MNPNDNNNTQEDAPIPPKKQSDSSSSSSNPTNNQTFQLPTPCTSATSHPSDSKFSDGPTYRSVASHRPSAHEQLHSVHSFHHDSAKFNASSGFANKQSSMDATFTLPNSKMVPTGGSFNVAQVPNLNQGFSSVGGRSSFRRSSSMSGTDNSISNTSDYTDVTVLQLPGLNSDSIANSHFEYNSRLFLYYNFSSLILPRKLS